MSPSGKFHVYHILYVDDEPSLLETGKLFLELNGQLDVDTRSSATDCIPLLATNRYDAIVSDYQMPEMDGIEFLKQVRSLGNMIPFILFTGKGREEVVIQALNAGADFYLQKGGDARSQYTELANQIQQVVKRKLAEEALLESQERLSTILNAAQVGIILVDAVSHEILEANPRAAQLIRAPADKVRGAVCHRFICPAEKGVCPVTDLGLEITASERVLLTIDGVSVPILKTVVSTSIGNRKVLVESFFDLTERKKAENALKESEEKYRRLSENAQDMVYRISLPDGKYQYVSPASLALTGYRPEDFYATPFFIRNLLSEDWQEYFTGEWESCMDGVIRPFYEYPITDLSGKTRWMNQRDVLVRDNNGVPVAIEGIVTEITERRRMEEALRQANAKLKLLSGITRHDINNQLTALTGYLDLLKQTVLDPASVGHFEKANTAAQRISTMIQFTKKYEEIGVNAPAWHDCNALVDKVAGQIPPGKILVKNDIPAGTSIFADPLIARVWYNLINNAVCYGGKISEIRFYLQENGGRYSLVCEDDGDGIPVVQKERIFDRGFGKNTGMGLFLAREILSITGITLHENGEYGKGARFEMAVPNISIRVNSRAVPVPAPASISPACAGGACSAGHAGPFASLQKKPPGPRNEYNRGKDSGEPRMPWRPSA